MRSTLTPEVCFGNFLGQMLNTAKTGPTRTGTPRQMQFMLRLNF